MNIAKQSAAKVRSSLATHSADAAVLFRPANTQYVSGFLAHIYSRPIIAVLSKETAILIVPALERDNARQMSWITDVRDYAEFSVTGRVLPNDPWAMVIEVLQSGGYDRIGVEEDFLPLGVYRRLANALASSRFVDASGLLMSCRMVKNRDELDTIRQAAKLADIGVEATLNTAATGLSELEIDSVGTHSIVQQAATLFPEALVDAKTALTASGPRTSDPHAASTTRRLETGDPFIHRRQVRIHGYGAESERTDFIGELRDSRLLELYRVMREAQQAAIATVAPGVPLEDVDRTARKIIADAGYGEYFVHRTGHGLGLESHEAPYLREGATEPMLPGMVVSIEPGIYIEGIGGVRHSDTVAVTETGRDVFTRLPKPEL